MDPIVAQQFSQMLVADAQRDARAHGSYLQTLDRAFLSNYLATDDPVPGKVGDLNTASHTPTPQPWGMPPTGPAQGK